MLQGFFGELSILDIFLDAVACNGTEGALLECGNNGLGVHDCTHNEDAGVICNGKAEKGRGRGKEPLYTCLLFVYCLLLVCLLVCPVFPLPPPPSPSLCS